MLKEQALRLMVNHNTFKVNIILMMAVPQELFVELTLILWATVHLLQVPMPILLIGQAMLGLPVMYM